VPKRPKYKKGYTWTHHFDEWWDRVGEEFRIKLFVFVLILIMLGGGFGLYHWVQQSEKKEMIELARVRQEKENESIRYRMSQRPIPPGDWSPRED